MTDDLRPRPTVTVARADLSDAYHAAPPRIVAESGHRNSYGTGCEAVARLIAERAGIELVITDPLPPSTGELLPFRAPRGVPEYRPHRRSK